MCAIVLVVLSWEILIDINIYDKKFTQALLNVLAASATE